MFSTIKIENTELLKGIDPTIKHLKTFKSLVGKTIGGLEVLQDMGGHRYSTKNGNTVTETIYLCKCKYCNRYKYMRSISLISSFRKSGKLGCGCKSSARDLKEGYTRNLDDKTQKTAPEEYRRLYILFQNMHANSHINTKGTSKDWANYNDGWDAFKTWANENNYIPGISRIKRLDPSKPFSPENCIVVNSSIARYSDPIDKNLYNTLYNYCRYNRKEKRFDICDNWNIYLNEDAYDNFKKWCIENGFVLYRSRVFRIDHKKPWSPENCKILNCGLVYKKETFLIYKKYAYSITEWSKILNLRASTISERLYEGMPDYDILSLVRKTMTKPEQRRNIDAALTEEWLQKNHYSELVSLGVITE